MKAKGEWRTATLTEATIKLQWEHKQGDPVYATLVTRGYNIIADGWAVAPTPHAPRHTQKSLQNACFPPSDSCW